MTQPEKLSVTLTREFDAPIDLVWSAWTEAEHVSKWMKCDAAVELECTSWKPEVGASYETVMTQPGQWSFRGTGRFTEVDPPNVLAYRSDPHAESGMPEMSVRVEFEELAGGRTRVTLTHSGIPGDEMCGIIRGGWTNSLGMLGELAARRVNS